MATEISIVLYKFTKILYRNSFYIMLNYVYIKNQTESFYFGSV